MVQAVDHVQNVYMQEVRTLGIMIEGHWHDRWYDTKGAGGRFVRSERQFHNLLTPDGADGPTGMGGYQAEAGRYHLYAALDCPWPHRALIFRASKGLNESESITASVTH